MLSLLGPYGAFELNYSDSIELYQAQMVGSFDKKVRRALKKGDLQV